MKKIKSRGIFIAERNYNSIDDPMKWISDHSRF